MHIGTSSYLFSSSTVLATGLYFREQSFTLYIIVTVGGAVKVSYNTIGRVARVYLFNYRRSSRCQLATVI